MLYLLDKPCSPSLDIFYYYCLFFLFATDQTVLPYSKCGLTRLLNSCRNMSLSMYLNDLLISPSFWFALLTCLLIWFWKFSLLSIIMPIIMTLHQLKMSQHYSIKIHDYIIIIFILCWKKIEAMFLQFGFSFRENFPLGVNIFTQKKITLIHDDVISLTSVW